MPTFNVILLSPHWSANFRLRSAANNSPPMRQNESDHAAVKLLQQALARAGIPVADGDDGKFGPHTAAAVVAAQKRFGFDVDAGVAGREVLGALDLSLRGWKPAAGAHWGGEIARTIVAFAQTKVRSGINALTDIQTMLAVGKFDFVTVDGVTMTALRSHFKLVPPGGTKLGIEEFITSATIDPLIRNFRGIQRTLANPAMVRHSIGTLGLHTAAEAPFGGPIIFGPPYSDFTLEPVAVTNIGKTGRNSLAAMMMHEATHVIDSLSTDDSTTHISESTAAYATQRASNARHNPSAFATFAAHIDARGDRAPPDQRFGLGKGRPL